MARKTKAITLWKSMNKEDWNSQYDKWTKDLPQFEVYKNTRRESMYTLNYYYEVKAKGPTEEIEVYLESQDNEKNAPVQPIIDLLKVELEPLRIAFHEKTQIWAGEEFERITKIANMSEEEIMKKWGKEKEVREYQFSEPKIKKYVPMDIRYWIEGCKNTYLDGIDKYREDAKKKAESHYQSSLIKLAYRISEKGMNIDKIKAKTEFSNVDVNISTVLTDGDINVRAWTIIASGPIQRPHYRYLVK